MRLWIADQDDLSWNLGASFKKKKKKKEPR